jgi:hypothetical protein
LLTALAKLPVSLQTAFPTESLEAWLDLETREVFPAESVVLPATPWSAERAVSVASAEGEHLPEAVPHHNLDTTRDP